MASQDFGIRTSAKYLLDQEVSSQDLITGVIQALAQKQPFEDVVDRLYGANWSDISKIIVAVGLNDPFASSLWSNALVAPILDITDAHKASVPSSRVSLRYVQGVILGLFSLVNHFNRFNYDCLDLETSFLTTLEELIFSEGVKVHRIEYIYPYQEKDRRAIEERNAQDWRGFECSLAGQIEEYLKLHCPKRADRVNVFCRRVLERFGYLCFVESLPPISELVIRQFGRNLINKLPLGEFLPLLIVNLPEPPGYVPYIFTGPLKEFWALTSDQRLYRISKGSIDQVEPPRVWGSGLPTVWTRSQDNKKSQGANEELIGVTLDEGIILYEPGKAIQGKYRPVDCCSRRRWKKATAPIVGLFVSQAEARKAYASMEAGNFDQWDNRFVEQFHQVLSLIKDSHPEFILNNDLIASLLLIGTEDNPARQEKIAS